MASEKRLIDANELKSQITRYHMSLTPRYISKLVDAEIGDVIDIVDEAPTVDAVEVVHGLWLDKTEIHVYSKAHKFISERVDCSACGHIFFHTSALTYNYCPNCGAKMDGGKDDGK